MRSIAGGLKYQMLRLSDRNQPTQSLIVYISKIQRLLIAIILFTSNSYASKTLNVGYVEFPPFNFTDENGDAQGSMADLARDIAAGAGYDISFRSYPAKRLAKNIVDGNIDFWIGLSTLENFSGHIEISSIPVNSAILRAYSTKPMPAITSKSDLNGKHIIVLHGYSYGDWFNYINAPKNNITYESAIKHDQALRMLSSHQVDYLLDYRLPIDLAKAKMDLPKLYFHDVFTIEGRIVVSKKLTNAKKVLLKLEDSYRSLQLNTAR